MYLSGFIYSGVDIKININQIGTVSSWGVEMFIVAAGRLNDLLMIFMIFYHKNHCSNDFFDM